MECPKNPKKLQNSKNDSQSTSADFINYDYATAVSIFIFEH